jgi:hypothetical protein
MVALSIARVFDYRNSTHVLLASSAYLACRDRMAHTPAQRGHSPAPAPMPLRVHYVAYAPRFIRCGVIYRMAYARRSQGT